MATITMTVYDVDRSTGANHTDNGTAATSGNTYRFANNGNVKLVTLAAAGANIAVVTPNTVDGGAITDKTLVAGTAKVRVFGPFPPNIYNDADGYCSFTVDANTTVLAVRG